MKALDGSNMKICGIEQLQFNGTTNSKVSAFTFYNKST